MYQSKEKTREKDERSLRVKCSEAKALGPRAANVSARHDSPGPGPRAGEREMCHGSRRRSPSVLVEHLRQVTHGEKGRARPSAVSQVSAADCKMSTRRRSRREAWEACLRASTTRRSPQWRSRHSSAAVRRIDSATPERRLSTRETRDGGRITAGQTGGRARAIEATGAQRPWAPTRRTWAWSSSRS